MISKKTSSHRPLGVWNTHGAIASTRARKSVVPLSWFAKPGAACRRPSWSRHQSPPRAVKMTGKHHGKTWTFACNEVKLIIYRGLSWDDVGKNGGMKQSKSIKPPQLTSLLGHTQCLGCLTIHVYDLFWLVTGMASCLFITLQIMRHKTPKPNYISHFLQHHWAMISKQNYYNVLHPTCFRFMLYVTRVPKKFKLDGNFPGEKNPSSYC